jgi:Neprosin
LQVWLQNYDKPQIQSLEGGWTVDQSLNADTQPHVFTYYTTNGYTKDGDNLGGYNRLHKGWIQYSPSVFPGIRINGLSTFGGGQTDVSMKFQLYREPNSNDVNWWVAVQGIWVGYYPATLYNGGLGNKVEWIGSGGEVYSSLKNPEATKDQMGSGWQAQAGWTKAAFLRNLRNQSNMNGAMVNNNGFPTEDAATSGGADRTRFKWTWRAAPRGAATSMWAVRPRLATKCQPAKALCF